LRHGRSALARNVRDVTAFKVRQSCRPGKSATRVETPRAMRPVGLPARCAEERDLGTRVERAAAASISRRFWQP